jgi:hypothetical protein
VLHVSSLAAAEKTKSGNGILVWRNIFEVAAEDLGGSLSIANTKRLFYLHELWHHNMSGRHVNSASMEQSVRRIMLIAVNYICLLKKSRMAYNATIYSLSRVNLSEIPRFPTQFQPMLLSPLDDEWKDYEREWNAACQLSMGIITGDFKRALYYFTLLWEWTPDDSEAKCHTDSLKDTRVLYWQVVFRFLPETTVHSGIAKMLINMGSRSDRMWAVVALIRACRFKQDLCDKEDLKEEQVYLKAKLMAMEQEELVFDQDIKMPMRDEYYDKHTKKGRTLGRGYRHFFDHAVSLSNELFPDPFADTAKHFLLEQEQKNERCKINDIRNRIRKDVAHQREDSGDTTRIKRRKSQARKESTTMLNPVKIDAINDIFTYGAIIMDQPSATTCSVLVQGPFSDHEVAFAQHASDSFKSELDSPWLNSMDVKKSEMIPDLFVQGKTEPSLFLTMRDVYDYRRCRVNLQGLDKKSSNCRPIIQFTIALLSDSVLTQLMCILIYRYGMEIGKADEGDILLNIEEQKVYSINEHSVFKNKLAFEDIFVLDLLSNKRVNSLSRVITRACLEWCNLKHVFSLSNANYAKFCENVKECLYYLNHGL